MPGQSPSEVTVESQIGPPPRTIFPRGVSKWARDGTSKRSSVLQLAQKVWSMRPEHINDLSIPHWYAGLYGVPDWHLRQPTSSLKLEKQKGLALLVRMNYVLDYYHKFFFGRARKMIYLSCPARALRTFYRSHGPPFAEGQYRVITPGVHMNTSYALSTRYCWQRALVCTVGNFVHLLASSGSNPNQVYAL